MTKRERDLRKQFQQLIARHRRKPTASSWFELGRMLADANHVSPDLGKELGNGLGDPIACWRQCVKLAPRNAAAWHQLGQAYFDLDDRVNATRALKRALKLDPHVAAAWNNLAIMAMPAPGDDDLAALRRAERYLRRAIEEDPRGKKLGWQAYAWLAEAAERRRDDPGALAWYAEANRRGDRWAAARKQVIEGHGARRRATTSKGPRPVATKPRRTRSRVSAR